MDVATIRGVYFIVLLALMVLFLFCFKTRQESKLPVWLKQAVIVAFFRVLFGGAPIVASLH